MKRIAAFPAAAELKAADEWLALRSNPLGLLLIGRAEQTSPVIAGLLPGWPAPVEICQGATFTPDRDARTLVLQDPGEMTASHQAALLEWMNDAADGKRVITTVRVSLFPRVESGLFSTTLYYRLNTITIDFGDVAVSGP
jgi:hypothetical protein